MEEIACGIGISSKCFQYEIYRQNNKIIAFQTVFGFPESQNTERFQEIYEKQRLLLIGAEKSGAFLDFRAPVASAILLRTGSLRTMPDSTSDHVNFQIRPSKIPLILPF